ncbi:YceI family protein [Streptomyces sp. CG1]|uniref:YceI family protein n=1 Tax=Streptomyces sp. CG1 TaxID=1287523 RepID=UPI0034E2C260
MEIIMLAAPDASDQLTGVWQIDPVHSQVGFTVRHLVIRMRGGFTRFPGTNTVGNEPARSSVRAEIDCTLVDTRNAERDKHIRAADFLDSDTHPTASFQSSRIRTKDGRHIIEGHLTLRGQMCSVDFDLFVLGVDTDVTGRTQAGFGAFSWISRSQLGVTGDVPLTGGRALIGDTVMVKLEIEAVQGCWHQRGTVNPLGREGLLHAVCDS